MNGFSFDWRSRASLEPDFVVCSTAGEGCTTLYTGSSGLYNLFHDSSLNLDSNGDGSIYIKINEGTYNIEAASLSSIADKERSWIYINNVSKNVIIEGEGTVTLSGASYLGGIYLYKATNVSVKNIKFVDLKTSTSYCKSTSSNECPMGKGFVLDNVSALTLDGCSFTNVANIAGDLYSSSKATLKNTVVSSLSRGFTASGASTITISEGSSVESGKLNTFYLIDSSKLVTSGTSSSKINLKMKTVGSGDTGYVIYANGNAQVELTHTNVESVSGGIELLGSSKLTLADSSVYGKTGTTRVGNMIYARQNSKIMSIANSSISNGAKGIYLIREKAVTGETVSGAASLESMISSTVSKNTNGIYVQSALTTHGPAIKKIEESKIIDNLTNGIYITGYSDVNVGKDTEISGHSGSDDYGIYMTGAANEKLTVSGAIFKNNLISIYATTKALPTGTTISISDSTFDNTGTQKSSSPTGINVTGKNNINIEKSTFKNLGIGVRLYSNGSVISFLDNKFTNNYSGILGVKGTVETKIIAYRNTFKGSKTTGALIIAKMNAKFRNNIFYANATAFQFESSIASEFINNTIANSTVAGLKYTSSGSYLTNMNNIYVSNVKQIVCSSSKKLLDSKSSYNFFYASGGSQFTYYTPQVKDFKDVSDPKLVVDTFTLSEDSPTTVLINTGNPSSEYNDRDKTRNNLGAYGGPNTLGTCGDGIKDTGEECDGTGSGSKSCNSQCELVEKVVTCGDGVKEGSEQCDDGDKNGTSGSTCDPTCKISCGNGLLESWEECDLGTKNGTANASCSAQCKNYCGNGTLESWEICDPGVEGTEDCSNRCTNISKCGDGNKDSSLGELCDDGNTTSGDGCSNICWWDADINGNGRPLDDWTNMHTVYDYYFKKKKILDDRYDLNTDKKVTPLKDYTIFLGWYNYWDFGQN